MTNPSTLIEALPAADPEREWKIKDAGAVRHLWLSPWASWVGLRYLKSKKNSKFLSFITLLSVGGVALGVTAMIVVLSVMEGFEGELKKRLMSSDLHVLIRPSEATPGFDSGYVPQESLDPGWIKGFAANHHEVVSFWPIVSTEAILKSGRKVTGVVFKGITAERMNRLKAQVIEAAEPQMMIKSEANGPIKLTGVFVGQELAYELGLLPGDEITLVSPTETEGPMAAVPRLKRYVVEGIYHSGMPEQELQTVFASESAVRSFLRRQGVVTQWEITLKDFESGPRIADEVRKFAGTFKVQDWIELNAHLFSSLRLERAAMFVILAFIIIVASFNIVTTLTLMVIEKTREIAILKAMGARHGQVAAIFLSEGLLIGGIGVGLGALAGAGLCGLLRRYEFISLPEIYYDRTLPVAFSPGVSVLICVAAFLIVLAACLYPSRRAARLSPLDGIRYG